MSDLISRQAAIDMLKNRWKKTRNYEGIGDDIAEECELYLKQVPSAQPERPKGEWIDNETSYADGVRQTCTCSVCGIRSVRPLGDFCRWCGADMRGQQDE